MGAGRFVCVALPLLLTLASLIALLVAGLAGVAGNKETSYMFRINVTNLQVQPSALAGLVGRDLHSRSPDDVLTNLGNGVNSAASDLGKTIQQMAKDSGKSVEQIAKEVAAKTNGNADDLIAQAKASAGLDVSSGNVTAADIGLNKVYDVSLWGFCYVPQTGDRQCLQPKFDWAKTEVNNTMATVKTLAATLNTVNGKDITIPKEVTDGLNTFTEVVRWTEVVFIIAAIALGLALVLGIMANFSTAVSCLTWVVQGVATVATIVFASLATATAVVVVGLVEATAKIYGASANFNGGYLAAVWIAVAFSIAAGVFWLATVCCCKPEHRRTKRHSDSEKLVGQAPSSYAPVQGDNGYYNNTSSASYGAPRQPEGGRSEFAYEPYSHAR